MGRWWVGNMTPCDTQFLVLQQVGCTINNGLQRKALGREAGGWVHMSKCSSFIEIQQLVSGYVFTSTCVWDGKIVPKNQIHFCVFMCWKQWRYNVDIQYTTEQWLEMLTLGKCEDYLNVQVKKLLVYSLWSLPPSSGFTMLDSPHTQTKFDKARNCMVSLKMWQRKYFLSCHSEPITTTLPWACSAIYRSTKWAKWMRAAVTVTQEDM